MSEINLKINLSYGDEYMSANITRDAMLWQFICWGIFLPVVSLIGLVGNALTIVVLWRKEMQSTTILYMRGLVLTDTGILLTAVIVLTPFACANYLHNDSLRYFRENIYPVLYTPINFTVMTLQSCNVWITVSVSVERYIAICHPFKAARICTRRKTIVVLIAISLVSVLYNIPRLFATYARECVVEEQTSGSSCFYLADTDLGRSYWYKTVYFSILYTILIFVVPLAALFILNVFLIQELMRMQRRRSGTNIHEENEANLSLVLVLIVVVFIFCQSPGLVSQFDIFDFVIFLKWIAVSNLLFVINSAVNFLIYTAFGSKFRKVLLRVFRRVFRPGSRGLSLRSSVATANGYELTTVHDNQTTVDTCSNTSARGVKVNDKVKDERTPLTSAIYCSTGEGASGTKPVAVIVPSTKTKADSGEVVKEVTSSSNGLKHPERSPLTKTDSSDSLHSDDVMLYTSHSSLKINDNDIDDDENRQLTQNNNMEVVKNEESALLSNGGGGPKCTSQRLSVASDDSDVNKAVTSENGELNDDVIIDVPNDMIARWDSSEGVTKAGRRVALRVALDADSVTTMRAVTNDNVTPNVASDRAPKVKVINGQDGGPSLKTDRYPVTNYVAANGPTPADV